MKYFFALGHQPKLSLAEIKSVLSPLTDFVIKNISHEVCIIETKEKIDLSLMQKKLGGTIKAGKIIQESHGNKIFFPMLLDTVNKICSNLNNSKIYFGFSLYNLNTKPSDFSAFARQINFLALKLKNKLKSRGLSSRWVSSKKRILSSVIVKKNKLLKNGFELVFLIGSKKVFWGQTLNCQDFRAYEIRDFKRPTRNIERGMIPLRLAKIMLNLADKEKNYSQVILDPFCGFGTILQEAAEMGYTNLIGSDSDKEMVEGAKENLKWFAGFGSKFKANIFQSDVRKISQKIESFSIDLIVTEPYLGPLKIRDWQLEIKKISNLYLVSFKEFKKILKPKGRICIIFPAFLGSNRNLHFLPILKKLKKMGWEIQPFADGIKRGSIIYSRSAQFVRREIFIFTNIKN
ncbi:hypothetical protein B6D52_00555 [Candidatus Parcubacteria bacterium 4484_255]|nr:MAG: hypothetical protein B6D52_00555 [Candidatus Parcubacteria bacterium 4484_255]